MYRAKAVLFTVSSPAFCFTGIISPATVKSGSLPSFIFLIAGNTRFERISNISLGSLSLNLDHRIDWPTVDFGNILAPFPPVKLSNSSCSSSFSSRDRINIRYVNCSITVMGFVMPPAQISVQILSTLFFITPVTIYVPSSQPCFSLYISLLYSFSTLTIFL